MPRSLSIAGTLVLLTMLALPLRAHAKQPISDFEAADRFQQCVLNNGVEIEPGPGDDFVVMCCTQDFCVFCNEHTGQGTYTDCYYTDVSAPPQGTTLPRYDGDREMAPPGQGQPQPGPVTPVEPEIAPQMQWAE